MEMNLNLGMHRIILSEPHKNNPYRKIIVTKKVNYYQIERFRNKQVFHENLQFCDLVEFVDKAMTDQFSQLNAWDTDFEYSLRVSKKGKVLSTKKPVSSSFTLSDHNRKKNYILPENIVVEPLVDMGIMTFDGKIVKSMYDKYKQINRFIEMIDDVVKQKNFTELSIIDFGCGKSYLTFILYYYLHEIKGINVEITGLDLKGEVIERCNKTAQKYGYNGLKFQVGDIKDYNFDGTVDMVISLHACDTATDLALFNAIKWGAKMIFCVPCCQHELNGQLESDDLLIINRYGIIQERVASLFTDAIRANLLEYCGYKTQLLEFIDISHTPKNLLIRAVKGNVSQVKQDSALSEVESIISKFKLDPMLYRLIFATVNENT